jgi:tetraacyldisaccharide 4'-kinase
LPLSKSSLERLTRAWRQRGVLARVLWPLGVLFSVVVALRRLAYRHAWLRAKRLPVPVIVVGNIIAGGAGKTPLTLWLARKLSAADRKPGIVSRGYGRETSGVLEVKVNVTEGNPLGTGWTAAIVGDEPLLLARRSGCPVFVGSDRAAAAQALLAAYPGCDLILCDDGLQHYRLARDVEIAVVDRRGLMNGWFQPAGPLREPASRLREADALVLNGTEATPVTGVPLFRMRLEGDIFFQLDNPATTCTISDLQGLKLHAVAGIGEPQRFFDHLSASGLCFEAHAFPDHHAYTSADLCFAGDALVMTEKDALKCNGLTALPVWVLPVNACIEPDLARFVLEKIDGSASA